MKRSVLLLMLAVALTLTSCDFMRKMSGRPTKEELNMLKGELERIDQLRQEEVRVRASIDSLEQVRKTLEDSLAVSQTVEVVEETPVVAPKPVVDNSRYLTANLENRYYVIIGAFQSYQNAKALLNTADKYGYSPVLIGCRNGLIGVGVCPVDDYGDALIALQMIKREKFCPANPWIYTNTR